MGFTQSLHSLWGAQRPGLPDRQPTIERKLLDGGKALFAPASTPTVGLRNDQYDLVGCV
jgi:hypothetical protein